MIKLAARMSRLGTETAFEVLVKAKALEAQGREIIHLEIGEPDFDTPVNIKYAAIKALTEGWTHYTPSAGIPELREAIAEEISKTRGIEVNPNQVVVTPGGKPIIKYAAIKALTEGWTHYTPSAGIPELREAIAEVAIENDAMVLSDEIYSHMVYEGEFASIASVPGMQERTIILDGFSKTYAMTGWRLGYGVMPEWLAEQIAKLMVNSNSCTAAFTQWAGVEALRGPQDESEKMMAAFKERRDIIVDGLNKIPGFRCLRPKGAFYVFPNIEGTGMSSREMQDYLLNEAGVACLSGTAFGKYGEGFLRFSYANSIENLQKALERIGEAVAKL